MTVRTAPRLFSTARHRGGFPRRNQRDWCGGCRFHWTAAQSTALALAALLPLHAAQPVQGKPTSTPTTVCNLGVLAPGQKIVRVIEVRNPFHQPFRAQGVFSTCGCTGGKLQHSVIPPAASCPLHLEVTARIWPGPEAVGVTVVGTAGRSGEALRYLVRYVVENLISFPGTGYYVNLGDVAESTLPQWRTLSIRRGGNPVEWDKVRCAALGRPVRASLGRPRVGEYRLRLRLAPTRSLGIRSSVLRFTFFNAGKELGYHLDRPVVFRVVGPVDLDPESILFGAVRSGRAVSRTLRLYVSKGSRAGHYRIVSVRVPAGSAVAARISADGRAVRVVLNAARPQSRVSGHVEVVISGKGCSYLFREDYLACVLANRSRGTHVRPK